MPDFVAPAPGPTPSAGGTPASGVVTPAPSESTGSAGAEGNITPASIDTIGAGGASGASSGASSETSTGLGGSAATSAGGAAMASAGATSSGDPSAGGTGETPPPDEPGDPGEPEEPASTCPANALFCDDFEDDAAGQFPAAPWQNNTGSGATVRIDGVQAFSGSQAVHVNAPPNAGYRRGYFSLEQGSSNVFPQLSRSMFGRAMMFLDATPNAVAHWTIIQAEGRAAAGTHDAYYRYGGQQQGGRRHHGQLRDEPRRLDGLLLALGHAHAGAALGVRRVAL